MEKRDIPILVKQESTGIAVKRKGQRVFIGNPREQGVWIDCANAPASKMTEALLKKRLRAGYNGTVLELVQEVGEAVTHVQDAREYVADCARELRGAHAAVRRAENDLAEAKAQLERIERDLTI